MEGDDTIRQLAGEDLARRHPVARRIVRAWRSLTPTAKRDRERGTLLAVSGGADSAALAIACASTPSPVVLAHVRHDWRSPAETEVEERRVRELADRLGRPCVTRSIETASEPGNAEANARRRRYATLVSIARSEGLVFVATGHHADDQLETLLMRLARGAGPRGLRGIAPSRSAGHGITLVRPMLSVTAQEARELCAAVGYEPVEDPSNSDRSFRRNAVRATVTPSLVEQFQRAPHRAVAAAETQRVVHEFLGECAAVVLENSVAGHDGSLAFAREDVRRLHEAVRRECLVRACDAVRGRGEARGPVPGPVPGWSSVRAASRFIASDSGETKRFVLGRCEVDVTAHGVMVRVGRSR